MPAQDKNELRKYFTKFLHEFRAGLRFEDQPYINKLVNDLIKISMEIPPAHKQYSFREILILMALINQKKINQLQNNSISKE